MNDSPLILVTDDDPDICIMTKMMLEINNYRVLIADDEDSTRKILLENKVDLLIMDMLLSGVDGTDVCRRLKADPQTAAIPVIMFSAHPNALENCRDAGANDFISKPFEMTDMLEKIKVCLQKGSTSSLGR